ncbi:hypothetical protein NP233_g12559 [Leucocoprinus birnbaumii]|uniref:Peptidase A1 domain-containing protein n=1 Tax=Leucocoprinus birnbaumii TaxID=56174 RepID=A0AAD5VGR9_9AGAR|nr:hypothetical protein NP233_g12559 [Leucocoprinus birnbaumii]
MLRPLPPSLLAYSLLFVDSLYAHQFSIQGRRHSHPFDRLLRRGTSLSLNNSADVSYHAEIFLGGQPFAALVDTGSSDLWIAGDVQQSNDTGQDANIVYAVGNVGGPIRTARFQLGDLQVENQAFIQVSPSGQNTEGTGVLGLGPSSGSFILQNYTGLAGAPPLDRLFREDSTTPNYFTILLGRDNDPTTLFSGSITIGSVLPEYNDILSAPKLPIFLESETNSHNQHFEVSLDQDGIIGPDNKPIDLEAKLSLKSGGRVNAVLDCGFSLPQVPRSLADAIYNRFVGAEFTQVNNVGNVWIVPCELEVNVTFIFGGREYPMHPLDMTLDPSIFNLNGVFNSQGTSCCIGSFQPFTFNKGHRTSFDLVLGMAFMRNVYTLFDYGDFVIGANTTDGDKNPYIQMLSITDPHEGPPPLNFNLISTLTKNSTAHRDFVQTRLGGIDTTGSQHLLPPPAPKKSPVVYYVIAAVVVVVVVIVVIGCIFWNRRRKRIARQDAEKITSQPSTIGHG